MPYDSKGNFSLPNGSTATTGTTVLASQHNIPLADIVSNGLSTVVLRDGRASMSGDLPMGGNKVTDLMQTERPRPTRQPWGRRLSPLGISNLRLMTWVRKVA
jgi:hypothetical protein